jgi:phosphonoacetate hydrolase
MDGSDPAYTSSALAAGAMPYLGSALREGFSAEAQCVIPSFTNPNNLSIVTGTTPSVHGICGNYFLDHIGGEAVMMNEPHFLRAETIFAAFSRAGLPLAIVTAKDKLRRLLGHGMQRGICFSAEKADQLSLGEHGITGVLEVMGEKLPSVYSADLTRVTLEAGVKLLEGKFPGSTKPQLLYLSTTDYIQHKHAPGSSEANEFYSMLDSILASLHRLDACWVLTADHGMSAKAAADGTPQVIYLQSLLDAELGRDSTRVILPISDPYVVHHGALGGFACVYTKNAGDNGRIISLLREKTGIEWVGSKEDAAQRFSLPGDRLGEVVVISDSATALGTRRDEHDLSGLTVPLRSHGGLAEQGVPLMSNRPLRGGVEKKEWHNYDAFDLALNLLG